MTPADHSRCRGTAARTAALLALTMLLAALPQGSGAQTCHGLDGSWILQPDMGNLASGLSFNPYFSITGLRLLMRTSAGRIEQQWIYSGPHLQRTTRYTFTADGTKQATAIADPMDFEYAAIAAEWQNCTLMQTGFSHLFGLEVVTTSTYVVSPDGRELTILQYGESPISIVDRRLVLRAEP